MGNLKHKYFKTISKLLTILLLIQFFCFETLPVMAATTPNITFSTNGKLLVGETIEILVNVSNVENLYGGSVDFVYDPSLIEINSIEKGSLFNTTTVETPVKTFGNGKASIAIMLTESNTCISGNSAFAVIKARVLKEGTLKLQGTDSTSDSDLSLSDDTCRVNLSNEKNEKIPFTSTDSSFNFTAPSHLTIEGINTDKPSPQQENTTIRFFPTVSGGTGNLSYRFWILEGNAWKLVQDFSTTDYYDWTPKKPGNYEIRVDVKDKTSNNTETIVSLQIPYSINSAYLSLTSIKTDKASPYPAKNTIRITSEAIGSSTLTYKFWVLKQGTGQWDVIQDFSSKNYYDWTPETPGNYRLWVDVKDSSGSMISKEIPYVVSAPLGISSINTDKSSPQLTNSKIRITPSVTGGSGDYTYKFWVLKQGTGQWDVVQDFSSKNYYDWTPDITGNYRLWVDVKDETGRMISKEIPYSINSFIFNTIETDIPSPSFDRSTIKISANTSGDTSSLSYKFWVLKQGTGKWDVVQDFSSKNYYHWSPKTPGNYTLWVDVKDKSGNMVSKQISYTIKPTHLSIVDVLISESSPHPANNGIIIWPTASGSGTLLYKFWIHDGYSWKVVQDFSADEHYYWRPNKAGNYKIWIDVKDSTGSMISKEIPFTITEPLTITSINTDKSSPQLTNSKIRISPNVTGGKGDYTYKFWVLKQGTGQWDVVQDFSSKNYYDWTPDITGNYRLWVDVKDETGKMISKEIPYSIGSFMFNTIKTNIPSPSFDMSTIKISANTSGDTSSLSYKFWVLKQGTGKWDVVQDFSSKNYYHWSPKTPGNYTLWVDVKDKSGNMISKQISYTIKPTPLSIGDVHISETSPHPANDGMIILTSASGSGTLLHKFWIHDGYSWKVVKDFSTDKHYYWNPDKAGNYKIWIDVKDSTGSMISAEIPFTITEPLTITSVNTDKSSPQLPNSTVRISPNVAGGKGDYTYKFWVLKQGTGQWDVVQDFSSKDFYDWTPSTPGKYKLWVDVKDSTGTKVSKQIDYIIN